MMSIKTQSRRLPVHLSAPDSVGLAANEAVAQYEMGRFRNFVYLILDWEQKKAAIIDPQDDLTQPLQDLERHGFVLEKILLTHTHWDHVAGVPFLLEKNPDLKVHVHAQDSHRLEACKDLPERFRFITDGEIITLGGLNIQVLHTPGHSAGESCFFLTTHRPYLFTGDTLFIRDCGRTDLESGNVSEMFASLQRLKKLPPDTVILPGHHYAPECASILGDEMLNSPPLLCQSVQELERLP